MHGIFFL